VRLKFGFLGILILTLLGRHNLAAQSRIFASGYVNAQNSTSPAFSAMGVATGTAPGDPIDPQTRQRQLQGAHLPTPLLYPTTDDLSSPLTTPTYPKTADVSALAPTDFTFQSIHDLTSIEAPATGTLGSPSLASMGTTIFYTGNWFAARSTDGGKTFTYTNPYTTFPTINGGFSGNQIANYAPAQDMMLWSLQYAKDSSSGTLRIARAIGSASVAANSWMYWNFNPQNFGFPTGNWMDFPNLTVGSTFLYVTSNVFRTSDDGFTGSVLFRIPLAQLAAGGNVTFDYFTVTTVGSLRCTEGATTTMYCGTQLGGNQVRIYRWADGNSTVAFDDIGVNAFTYLNKDGVATSPDATNWAGRADSRISGAYVANGIIGLMWAAKQGGGFAYPYSIVARFNEGTRAFIDQASIWSSQTAFLYPTASVGAAGNLAGIIYFGGGFYYPTGAAWINDDVESGFAPLHIYSAAESDAGPSSPQWGDYFTARRNPIAGNTWVGGVFYQLGGGANSNTRQRYLWFGRIRDFSGVIQVTVQTNPVGLQISVDGTAYTAPQTFNWFAGSNHTIATTSPQGTGTRQVFAAWTDGGAISHSVAPATSTTYTANFTTQYLLTTVSSPGAGGVITPNPSGANGYYNAGTSVELTAVPNPGYVFLNWSGGLTGTTNPQSLTLSAQTTVTAVFSLMSSTGLRFVPVTPCRVADTRNPNGPFGGPIMGANSTRTFTVPSSTCGIPSTALAYALNVTVSPTSPLGYLTIWPAGQSQPLVSTLNSLDGRIKANAAMVVAGTGGAVSVFVTNETHVILDISGYFTLPVNAPSGLVFYPLPPCRVVDTRQANGPLGGPILPGGVPRTVPIQSSTCGIPASAAAYSLNMTVVPTGFLDYLTTWPTGTPQPLVSTLNDYTGTVVANAAIVPAGTGGSIDVYSTQQTHLIIDVNGYFAPPGTGGLLFYALTPCRVVDTRNPNGPYGGPALSGSRTFNLQAGACSVPAAAQAFSLNATIVPSGVLDYLTLWPTAQSQPLVSTLNSYDASIVSNAAIVPGSAGSISAFSTNTTQLILDLNGYFGP